MSVTIRRASRRSGRRRFGKRSCGGQLPRGIRARSIVGHVVRGAFCWAALAIVRVISGCMIQDAAAVFRERDQPQTVAATVHVSGTRMTGPRKSSVTTSRRVSYLANLPTVAGAGVTGYEMVLWIALFAPAGTPPRNRGAVAVGRCANPGKPGRKRQAHRTGHHSGRQYAAGARRNGAPRLGPVQGVGEVRASDRAIARTGTAAAGDPTADQPFSAAGRCRAGPDIKDCRNSARTRRHDRIPCRDPSPRRR